MNPYFTIMIPVFNQMGKMEKCVETLKNQTFDDFEVLLVDDGSSDGSLAVLYEIADQDSRFRVIEHKENKSVLNARITAIKEAKGSYLTFIDIDDYIELDALEQIYHSMQENPVDVLTYGFIFEPEGRIKMPAENGDLIRSYLRGEIPPCVWKSCYSKDVMSQVLENVESFYSNMAEDGYITGLIYTFAKSFGTLPKVLYHYQFGGMSSENANLNIEKLKKTVSHVEASYEALIRFFEKNNKEYVEDALYAWQDSMKTLLYQYIPYEKDLKKVVEYLSFFDNEKYKDIYEFGCNELLRMITKVRYQRKGLI